MDQCWIKGNQGVQPRMMFSMFSGCSPTATFVIPGRSTRDKVITLGLCMLSLIGSVQMPWGGEEIVRKKVELGNGFINFKALY